jgi:hypothetical protein
VISSAKEPIFEYFGVVPSIMPGCCQELIVSVEASVSKDIKCSSSGILPRQSIIIASESVVVHLPGVAENGRRYPNTEAERAVTVGITQLTLQVLTIQSGPNLGSNLFPQRDGIYSCILLHTVLFVRKGIADSNMLRGGQRNR